MSYFRRYDLTTKNTAIQREPSPGKYRKLTDDEVYLEWMRTRGKLSTSPPATPPLKHPEDNREITSTGTEISPKSTRPKKKHISESLLRSLKESSVDDSGEFSEQYEAEFLNSSVDSGGGKMYAVIKRPDVFSNGDLKHNSGQAQVDHIEEFVAKTKRPTLHGPSGKKGSGNRQTRNASPKPQSVPENRKFVLVANCSSNVKGKWTQIYRRNLKGNTNDSWPET